ncbi:hypothetical protein NHQ30_008553 [Ciborinia camelliae]|nr:hypothetical protein NHQ30_008553 [Ciborinia camelliae]
MSLEIHEVKSALEFFEIIQVQASAFDAPISVASHLFYPIIGSGPNARLDAIKALACRSWFRHSIDKYSHWVKVTDPALGNKVVGGGCWRIVMEEEKAEGGTIDPWWLPESEKREYSKKVFEIWADMKGDRGPHLGVEVVFADPQHRRRGIGSLVIGWGTKKADELGLDCYVEGSQTGVPLYKAHGFEIIRDVEVKPKVEEDKKSEEWKALDTVLVETMSVMRRPHKAA